MIGQTLYADRLVEITTDGIRFHAYYFPLGDKWVPFTDIERITAERPTLLNGRWRIHGSSDFGIWFPRDWRRPTRGLIFFVHRRGGRSRIGFTVEDEDRAVRVLRERGLLRDRPWAA